MRIDIAEAMICEMILKSIEQDDVKAIEAVLSGGVDPNKPLPSTGFSMLYVAATMPGDHAEVVQVLLNGGARPNGLTHEGLSPLYVAAQQGNSKCVRALIRTGADVNFTTRGYQATPLINASEEGMLGAVQALVEAGADVNRRNKLGTTALGSAIKSGHLHVANYLQSHGAIQ